MPITRLYTTGLLLTCPLPYCILLVCYQQAHYQTVYYCSATNHANRPINQTVYHRPTTHMPITRLYTTVLLKNRPINRLCTTVLLPACPLPDCMLLFCYQRAHYQTVYYCSATNRPITRLKTTVLLPIGKLPDCILLFCYRHAHYQAV